jgi:hypothetical protein
MKQSRKVGVGALVIGLIGFMNVTRNPRFESFHAVDVLQLVASGMCLGIALMAILGRLRPRREE